VDGVLSVGDAAFQRKCLGRMSDVAHEGRTVLFVSHNMSAILNLTQRAIVLERGRIRFDGPTAEAVDLYLSAGLDYTGERTWPPRDGADFQPLALRVRDGKGRVVSTVRSTEPVTLEMEYRLARPIQGLRLGIYLTTMRGEYVFVSFDTDAPAQFERWSVRPAGHYLSRCTIPANLLNEGRYLISVNASVYGLRRYFLAENALSFTVDATGAPGSQWAEPRAGVIRPALDWMIEPLEQE